MAADMNGFSPPYRLSYQLGVYHAVNAIPDAYLLNDGPDCVVRKAQYVQGKHDWHSTLLDVEGCHRIVTTLVSDDQVVNHTSGVVRERLRELLGAVRPGIVFLNAMPHVALLGLPYEQIAHEEGGEAAIPMAEIDGQAIKGDWLDGYSDTLATLARTIALPAGGTVAGSAAIIGLLVHRLEADCLADVAEVRRLVEGAGLDVCSVWLDGVSRVRELAEAGRAELLVALPSGVRAARALAARTGARVVEVPTPLGLAHTQRFLRALGRVCDGRERVEGFVAQELRRVVPTLEFALPHVFRDRRVAFSGDPHWFCGFALTCEELGMRVVHLSAPSRAHNLLDDLESELVAPPEVFLDCRESTVSEHLRRCSRRGLHLMVGTSDFLALGPRDDRALGTVELGFPSNYDHALFRRPTLGFEGWLCLVDRMGSALARAGVHAGARARPLELWPRTGEYDEYLEAVSES